MDQNNESPKIVFEGENFKRPLSTQTPVPKMVQWVIKYSGGIIKNENQANYVLIAFAVIAIVISLFLVFGWGRKTTFTPKYTMDNVLDTTIQNLPNNR
ncbi:MAG: hypothetical protein NUV47_00910 [Patescibacteria group bacterium]|nr:hypothetical protein [Patescibacteria group bacterium]